MNDCIPDKCHHTRRRTGMLLAIFAAALCLTACAVLQKTIGPSDPQAQAVIDNLVKNEYPDSMQAFADVEINALGKKYSTSLAVVVKKPQFLRIESIPLIGTPDLFLTADEHQMKVFLPREGAFYIGKPSAENLGRFLPVQLPLADVPFLFMGQMTRPGKPMQWIIGARDGHVIRIDGNSGGARDISVWIDAKVSRIVKTQLFTGGELNYTFSYQDYTGGKADAIPKKIVISSEKYQADVTIRYRDIEYPVKGEEDLFNLTVPKGISPRHLD